jgi:hypothetical protein
MKGSSLSRLCSLYPWLIFLLVLVSQLGATAAAQRTTGGVSGRVADRQGAFSRVLA